MAVDVSKIPNNSKFDPVRQAILDLQGEISSGVAGVGSINGASGSVTLTGVSPITISSSASTSQITIGVSLSVTQNTASGSGTLTYNNGVFTYTPPDLSGFLEDGDLSDYLKLSETGTQTVAGNVVVSGNLTVSGTTTYINTTNLNIGDNIITLNADLPSNTAPTQNAGIEINRGSSTDKTFLWDETADKWTLGSETLVAGTFEGSLTGTATNADKVDGKHATDFNLQYVTGNNGSTTNEVTIKNTTYSEFDSNNTDITGLLSGSAFGTWIKGRENGHVVVALRDNDNADSFAIISGGGDYTTDTTYDKLLARFEANGNITLGGNTNISSGALKIGGTTTIDSSRNVFANDVTGNDINGTFGNFGDVFLTNASGASLAFKNSQGNTADADNLATMSFQGYYDTGFVGASRIQVKANEDFSSTARGTVINFDFWDTGSTYNTVASIDSDGLYIGTTNVYDNLPDGITWDDENNRLRIGVSKNVGQTTTTLIQPILLANLLTEGSIPYVASGGAGSSTVNSKVSDSWLKLTTDTLQLGASDPVSHEIKYARFLWQAGQNDKISTVYGARDITASIQYLGGSKTAKIEFTTGSGGGRIQFNDEYTFPATDGTSGQILGTNGSGDLSWVNGATTLEKLYITGGDTNSAGTTFWWRQGNSGDAGSTWRKVCDVDIPTGLWTALSMDITYYYPGSNHGSSASLLTKKYSASFRRSNGTQDGYDDAILYGDDVYKVRIVKIGTGDYELQARAYANNLGVSVEYVVTGGNANWVTPATSIVAGDTTGTEYTASPNAETDLELAGDIVAKAFYDADNTAYYVNPNGTSVVLSMTGLTSNFQNSTVTGTLNGNVVFANEFDLPSGGMLDWANGDARIVEGLVNNYSLSFQTYDGSAVTTALRLDGDNTATFSGDVDINGALDLYRDVSSGFGAYIDFREGSAQDIRLGVNVFDGELPQAGTGLVLDRINSGPGDAHLVVHGEIFAAHGGTPANGKRVYHTAYHPEADNADTLDGLHASQFLRSDADDTYTGTLTVNGNISFSGDSRRIDLSGGTTNAQNALIIGEQNVYGVRFRWDSGSALHFDGYWNSSTTGAENRDLGYIDVNNRIWYLYDRVVTNRIDVDTDIYVGDQIIHTGDTDTYTQFHAADQWRVVTGGSERLEVNNAATTVQNPLIANDFLGVGVTPTSKFHVVHTTFPQVRINDDTGAGESGIRFRSYNGTIGIHSDIYTKVGAINEAGYLGFRVNYQKERFRLYSWGGGSFGVAGNGNNDQGRWLSFEGNTDASGEGSGRLFFSEHNSTTTDMDKYGMSIGYRGGGTLITTAGGGSWAGLSQIGNGQWGMWGHNADVTGALIMYGDRAATFVNFSGNDIQNTSNIYVGNAIFHEGDTNTYTQFHAADQWRVVTGGAERLEVNNTQTTIAQPLVVNGSYALTQDKIRSIDGENYFNINDDTTVDELIEQFGTITGGTASAITKVDDNTAPAPGCFELNGGVYFDGGGDYIKVDPNSGYTWEMWVKYVSGTDTDARVYLGWTMFNSSKTSFGNVQRYWGVSGSQFDADSNNLGWYKIQGTIAGIGTGTGQFISGTEYAKTVLLLNYNGGTNVMRVCGFKLYKSRKRATELQLFRKDSISVNTAANNDVVHTNKINLINAGDDSFRVETPSGYIDIGPKNTSWCHIYTDRAAFYTNKEVYVNNQKVLHTGDEGSGNGLDADLWDGNQFSSYLNQAVLTTSSPTFTNMYVGGYIYHSGDTDTYIRMVGADDMQLVCGGRQMLRMTEGTDPDKLRFTTDNDWTNSSGQWRFHDRVGINIDPSSTAPNNAKLLIQGSAYGDRCFHFIGSGLSSVGSISMPANCSGVSVVNGGASGQSAFSFVYGTNTQVGRININSTSTSYVTTSDYRLKENLVDITDGIDRLKLLKPKRFNFIGHEEIVDGFVAHEAQEVVPEAVTGEKDGIDWEGNPEYQGIDQAKLVPLLTAALQEAIAKIESLEARVSQLENNV